MAEILQMHAEYIQPDNALSDLPNYRDDMIAALDFLMTGI